MFLRKLFAPLLLIQFLYAADTNDPVIQQAATQFSQGLQSLSAPENVKSDLEITTVAFMQGLKTLDNLQIEANTIIGVLDAIGQSNPAFSMLIGKLQHNADQVEQEKAKVLAALNTLKSKLSGVAGSQTLMAPLHRMEIRLTTAE